MAKQKVPLKETPSKTISPELHLNSNSMPLNDELIKRIKALEEENLHLKEQNASLILRDTRFQLITRNSSETILFQNKELIYIWVVNSTPLMALEQIIGKTDADLLSRNEALRVTNIKKHLLETGESYYEEVSLPVNDTIRYFGKRFQVWFNEEGKAIGIATYFRDISDQKVVEQELKKQLEGEKLVADISAQFIAAKIAHIEEQIPDALHKMASYLEADRGVVRLINPETGIIQRGFEWNARSLASTKLETPGLPMDFFSWTDAQLRNNQPVYVADSREIPDEAVSEREFLLQTEIRSLVLLPLFVFGVFFGYVGFGSATPHPFWSEREKGLLELFRTTIVNVLERRDRENALNESQEQYQTLSENSPNAIFIIQNNQIIYSNQAGARLFGYENPEELINVEYEKLIPKEMLTTFRQHISKTGKTIKPVELSFHVRGNRNVVVEFMTLPIKLKGKGAFLAIGVDITHRKRIEEEIESNRRFLNDILNISPLAIFVYDRISNQMVFFNNAASDIFGYSSEEFFKLDNRQILQSVHPEDLQSAIQMNQKLERLSEGEVLEGDFRWLKPDGTILYLHSYQTAINRSSDGATTRTLTIVQNMTEYRKTQEELRKSEDDFRKLVENIPGIVYQALCDENFTTIYISDYFTKLTNIDKNDILFNHAINWKDMIDPDDWEKLSQAIGKSIKDNTPFEVEYRLRKANGEYIWIVDTGRVTYDEDNQPLYINGIMTDISTRKRDFEAMRQLSQDNLRLLAQARRDSETKTLLLNEVNHRVKNNIASIIGLVDLEAKREIHSPSDYENVLSNIKTRISGLATVHDILSSNQWAPVQLDLFLRKIIENASSSSPIGRKVSLNIYAQDRNLWVNSRQATALALIFNELTTNAIRHAFSNQEKGAITVTIRKEAKDTNRVRICFADNGPGWPEEILAGKGGNVGMQVIRLSAISPLYGEIKFENHNGATAIITFNLAPQRDLLNPSVDVFTF
ncbi:PAS domain S-box protein [Leptolinea tardivitalis]|uniref:histidine kinase n=1 Tax=Leptolinea tardivitalis TaxID=229920 RepID=A0A0P6XTP1_9CHLR|nr:PAS domain S-box protein [Leptolinea tardivitalis]KPL72816.1 hypothetical protein ADM99_07045 [Leptolinea tardivitalis]GAP20823.1 protein containing PAS domain S-box [Leptolinea tardivitalis]